MYMPIMRGKRFELLALRDLAAEQVLSDKIVPIVEPVRTGTTKTDLRRAIDAWISSGGSMGVVVNPGVGQLKANLPVGEIMEEIHDAQGGDDHDGGPVSSGKMLHERLFPVLIVSTGRGEFEAGISALRKRLGPDVSVVLWLRDNVEVDEFRRVLAAAEVKVTYLLVSESRIGKRLAQGMKQRPGVVVFADHFPGKATNAEYPDRREQVFTEEHLYFRDDGLAGFSDFGTIGGDYRDGGGAPKYVVIHWTYQKVGDVPADSPIYLQHFCSSDGSVVAPVQAKYLDAANKLVEYCAGARLPETPGLRLLRLYHDTGGFPGLGMLKKISILNHLFVVDRALGVESL